MPKFVRKLRKKFHPVLILGLLLVVGGGLAWWLMPIAADAYRRHRAERQTEEATAALGRGDFVEARDLSRRVLNFQPENLPVLAKLMTSADRLNDPVATRVAMALLTADAEEKIPAKTREEAWDILTRRLPTAKLFALWMKLPEDERRLESRAGTVLDRLIEEGSVRLAREVLAFAELPDSVALELRRLRVLAAANSAESGTALVLGLIKALYDHPEQSNSWVELLGAVKPSEIDARELRQLVGLLAPLADQSPDHALRLARLRMAAEPARAEAIYAEARDRFGPAAPWITARWCLDFGRPEDAAGLIDFEAPAEKRGRFGLQVRLLALTEGEAAAAAFLETAAEDAGPVDAGFFRTRAADFRGEPKVRDAAAAETLGAAVARTDAEAPLRLARRAEAAGLRGLARDAWVAAFQAGEGPLPFSGTLGWVLEDLAEEGRGDELFTLLSAFRRLEPGNRGYAHWHSYLALIKGLIQPETVIESFADETDQTPRPRRLDAALALAHLLEGRAGTAAEILDRPGTDWFAVETKLRALRAIALTRLGDTEEAGVLLEDLPWEELFLSERRVLRGLLEIPAE